jgi:hypothetical protein
MHIDFLPWIARPRPRSEKRRRTDQTPSAQMILSTRVQERLATLAAERVGNHANLFPAIFAKTLIILTQYDLFTKATTWRVKPV